MNKEKMTVHMALTEMKTMSKRIQKRIDMMNPIGTKTASATNVFGINVDEFKDSVKSEEESVLDLIARQNAIKAALYEYNTTTKITVAGKEMTVAHALWMKEYGMASKQALLMKYEKAYANASEKLNEANGPALDKAAERAADVVYASKDKSESEEYLKMCESYKRNHQLVYVDPLDLQKRITELSEEIETFLAEVDARIQTANAITELDIEY